MIFVFVFILYNTTNSLSELFALHGDIISWLTFGGSFISVWDDVGIFCNGDSCFSDITSNHSYNNTCLFAFINSLWNTLFKWILNTSQSQNSKISLIKLRHLISSLLLRDFPITYQQSPQWTSSKLIKIKLQQTFIININCLNLSILTNIFRAFRQQ